MMCGKKKYNALIACCAFLLCRLAARVASIAYVSVAADVLYREGALPGILAGVRSGMTWLSILVTVLSFSLLSTRASAKTHTGMAWGFSLICLADAAAVFLSDLLSGAFQNAVYTWMGLAVVIGTFLIEVAYVWLVCILSSKLSDPKKSVFWASLVHVLGWLAMESVYLIQFLIEVDFSPYKNEVISILRSYGSIVLWQGAALWLAAVCICRLTDCKKTNRARSTVVDPAENY